MEDCQETKCLSADVDRFGFIIVSSREALFGSLQGNNRSVITTFSVDLPQKRGDAMRFARLRKEKRENYVRKIAEMAEQCFIIDGKANITGVILGVESTFTTAFQQADVFDARLQEKLLQRVIISYGGENGFQQAIDLASEILIHVKFIEEKKVITRYFAQVSTDGGRSCFGVNDTLNALEMGAVETLIVWELLEKKYYYLRDKQRSETKANHFCHAEEKEEDLEWEYIEEMPLLQWLTENCHKFNTTLEMVTNQSQEGAQFLHGFDGIGGILRYTTNIPSGSNDKDTELFDLDQNDDDYASFFDSSKSDSYSLFGD